MAPGGVKEEVELGGFSNNNNPTPTITRENDTLDSVSETSVPKGFHQHGDLEEANSTSGGSGTTTSSNDAQAGVKNIEAVAMTWTKCGLIIAYAR